MFLRHDSGKSLDFVASVGSKLGMHHLRNRFRKPHAPRQAMDVHDATAIRDEQAIRLPTELLILIASYSQCRGDLTNLCLVSKTFRNVATPMLYRTIEIGRHEQGPASSTDTARHLLLYRTLQDIHLSPAVTEVHLTLRAKQICGKHIPSTAKWRSSSSSRHCSCEAYDQALGKALLCLNNLEILDFQCELCRGQHFHDYLHHLDMPRLKGLGFKCASSPKRRALLDSESILQAPYMRNITTLALDCHFEWLCGNAIGYQQFLNDAEVLPNLRAIVHNGSDFADNLLTARSVERIWLNQTSQEDSLLLQESIWVSPGILSHLISVNILEWLPNAMGQDLKPYRYLRYIGTIGLPQFEEVAALNAMSVFIPLKHLKMVEINRIPKPQDEGQPIRRFQYIFSPSPSFFDLLGLQHPTLRRVLLISRQYLVQGIPRDVPPVLWEYHNGWERRLLPSVGYWDILNGKLDNV